MNMIQKTIKNMVGRSNIFYLKSFFPNSSKKIMRKKRRIFYSSFIKKGDLCFDVGANIGNRIDPLLDIGAKVIAIEPQEDCYKFLELKYGKKIRIVKKGLGEKKEFKDFFISDLHSVSTFSTNWMEATVKSGRFKSNNWENKINVSLTTLDEIIKEFGLPIFIKIDVEGYELEVLKGLSHPVNFISFEYTVPEQFEKAIDCIEQMRKTNSDIECNYSVGESMIFKLNSWIDPTKMIDIINSDDFKITSFGDIYIRRKSFA